MTQGSGYRERAWEPRAGRIDLGIPKLRKGSDLPSFLRERYPELAGPMDEAREDVLADMAFPRARWPRIASTNPLERFDGEIERRPDAIGICLDDGAVLRLVGALTPEQNDGWTVSRRSTSLESPVAPSGDPVLRLSAVAARATLGACRGPALLHQITGYDRTGIADRVRTTAAKPPSATAGKMRDSRSDTGSAVIRD